MMIQFSLNLVPKDAIDNRPALDLVMAWCRTGNKPLPEPMITKFHTHIYKYIYISGVHLVHMSHSACAAITWHSP